MQTLERHHNNLRGGDTIQVSYPPGGGTTLSVNGNIIVTRPGDDLINTTMKLWIDANPVSQDIKRDLLQGSC